MMGNNASWKYVKLAEIAEFRNGVNYNRESFGNGVKVVGVKDFQDYSKPKYETLEQINPEGVVTSKSILCDGDIIFVRSNGNRELIGRSLFIDRPKEEVTHSAFTIRVRFKSPEILPKFYSYFFRTSVIRKGLTAHGGGTNISNLNQDILGSLDIPLPDLPTQRKIAGILSAYDDLIENNLRRIKILEQMAQSLYREWFVHFRFPGHESAKFKDSELGRIPEGWEVKSLDELTEVILDCRGKTPKKLGGDWSEEGIVALSALNVKTGHLTKMDQAKTLSEELYTKWMKIPLKRHDILLTSEAPLGECYLLPDDTRYCLSQRLFALRSNPEMISPALMFYSLTSDQGQSRLQNRATGTTVRGIRQAALREVEILVPNRKINELAGAFFERTAIQLANLHRRNHNLRRTRDLLLPKLISPANQKI